MRLAMIKIGKAIELIVPGSYYLEAGQRHVIVRTRKRGDVYVTVEDNGGVPKFWVDNGDLRVARHSEVQAIATAGWMGR